MALIELPLATTHQLPARFDAHEVDAFRSMIEQAYGDVVLDLGRIRFIDTSGLNALLEARAARLERGWELWVENLSTTARVTLELAGLAEAFPSLVPTNTVAA